MVLFEPLKSNLFKISFLALLIALSRVWASTLLTISKEGMFLALN
jgi:hypothetical protein